MNRRNNRSFLRLLGLPVHALRFNTDDDTLAGGGGGDDKKKKKESPKDLPEEKKHQLTDAELAAIRQEAKDAAKAEADAARKAEKEAAEKADLEKKGETQKLLDKERADRTAIEAESAALKLKLKRADVKDQIRKHLEKNHKDYVGALDDIALHVSVEADTKDDEIANRIKEAASGFVQRNPRGRMNVPPPPPSDKKKFRNNADPEQVQFTGASRHY